MQLGYAIIYVSDVPETVRFYEDAFGVARRFIHESNLYAEMETGATALAFAANAMAEMNGVVITPNRVEGPAPGFEIAFVTEAVQDKYNAAVAAGATPVKAPTEKPWGQVVGYVRDNNGCLVEIASPISP